MVPQRSPARVIGDKAYDSDRLDEILAAQGIEMIAPNRLNRSQTQDGRLCDATNDAGPSNALSPGFKTTAAFASAGKVSSRLPRFPSHGLRSLAHQRGFGIASRGHGEERPRFTISKRVSFVRTPRDCLIRPLGSRSKRPKTHLCDGTLRRIQPVAATAL